MNKVDTNTVEELGKILADTIKSEDEYMLNIEYASQNPEFKGELCKSISDNTPSKYKPANDQEILAEIVANDLNNNNKKRKGFIKTIISRLLFRRG